MRFHPRQLGIFASRRNGSTLPLSTLLLAALCVLLAAPASHAGSQDEVRAAILTRVIAASASSTQLSALETRQVKVLLSRLEKTKSKQSLSDSLSQIERELTALDGVSTPPVVLPSQPFPVKARPQYSLTAHEAAQLSGVRTNAYLE